jgi:hypothetical protein
MKNKTNRDYNNYKNNIFKRSRYNIRHLKVRRYINSGFIRKYRKYIRRLTI